MQDTPDIAPTSASPQSVPVLGESLIALYLDQYGRPDCRMKIKDTRDKLALASFLEITAQRLRRESSKELLGEFSLAA